MTENKIKANRFRKAFPEAAYMTDREILKELRSIKEQKRIIDAMINGAVYKGCRIA